MRELRLTGFANFVSLRLHRIKRLVAPNWIAVPVVLLMAGCRAEEPSVHTIRSPVVPFHEMFELADTVRLDPSILIGSIGFLDVSETGSLLITDYASRITHLFSATGKHMQSFSVPECLPDDSDFSPWSARFVGGGHVLVMDLSGPAVLFDLNGACVTGKRGGLHLLVKSFCTRDDSIFTHKAYDRGQASSTVYNLALEPVAEVPINPPRLVVLNFNLVGMAGRSIECFNDGAYYVYLENMDAMPLRARPDQIRYRPDFFQRWPKDAPDFPSAADLRKYPTTSAVFALDASTRMLFFIGLDRQWVRRDGDTVYSFGLSVASNQNLFPSRSTVSPVWPEAAANGYFYVVGDYESLPGGEVGNPLMIRYRFIPPQHENV